jgi:hypothetical protein
MGDSQPRSPDQRDQEQDLQMIDTNDRTPKRIQSIQQRMSWIAKEANRKLEVNQKTQPYLDELFGNLSHL